MSQHLPCRTQVIQELKASLEEELLALERVSSVTREEVTSDETRSEGKYDTRSTEASYLARGQAWRIAHLRQLNAWASSLLETPPSLETVCMGSIAVVEADSINVYFVAPTGGTTLHIDRQLVRVVSPDSPLGKALVGTAVDDEFQFRSPSGVQELCVVEVG